MGVDKIIALCYYFFIFQANKAGSTNQEKKMKRFSDVVVHVIHFGHDLSTLVYEFVKDGREAKEIRGRSQVIVNRLAELQRDCLQMENEREEAKAEIRELKTKVKRLSLAFKEGGTFDLLAQSIRQPMNDRENTPCIGVMNPRTEAALLVLRLLIEEADTMSDEEIKKELEQIHIDNRRLVPGSRRPLEQIEKMLGARLYNLFIMSLCR